MASWILSRSRSGRSRRADTGHIELTWTNKDLRLLSHDADTYEWAEPTNWRVTEVRTLRHRETVGESGSGNLLIEGDAAHTLDALLRVPELAAEYEGKVKMCYVDPPFNTGQAFAHYNDAVEHSVWLTMLPPGCVAAALDESIAEDLGPLGLVYPFVAGAREQLDQRAGRPPVGQFTVPGFPARPVSASPLEESS